jgi:phage terminase Nu1 subunit (DNA packaging protein)
MAEMRKDLAKLLGVSAATVTRDAAAGMPTHDLDAARAWRAQHRRPRASPPPRAGAAGFPEGAVAAGPATVADEPAGENGYWLSRARREAAEAELAELKLAELQGQLVRADEWAAALARRAAAFREGLLQIPARVSAQLAAEADEARIHAMLDAELRQVMLQLTDAS